MWLRWLILWGTLGVSLGLGLGLVLFADVLGIAGGARPRSILLERLDWPAALVPLEWLAVLFVLLLLAVLALAGRRGRD